MIGHGRALGVVIVVAVATAACSSDDANPAPTTTGSVAATTAVPATTAAPAGTAPPTAPATSAPAAAADTTVADTPPPPPVGFARVAPGGDCRCSDASEFSFYVREADPSRVVLFFQGGGACFSAETCALEGGTYKPAVTADDDPTDGAGMFDFGNARNPLADHSFVYVPYCTGDVHLGNKTTEYSPELTVQHKGFVNGSAALDELVETFPDAEEVLVTGESAGAIPSPLFAGLVSDRLPDARITVLADGSGAYRDVPAVNAGIGALWGTGQSQPDWPETRGLTAEQWSLPGLFVHAGAHDPRIVFARHDYAYDAVQASFGAMTNTAGADLLASIDENEEEIEATGVELASFVAPGDAHTTLSQDSFYTERVGGVRLVDWVTALVEGEPVDDVHCTRCRR